MKNQIPLLFAVILLGITAFCLYRIYQHYSEETEQVEVCEELYELIEQPQTDEDSEPIPLNDEYTSKNGRLVVVAKKII